MKDGSALAATAGHAEECVGKKTDDTALTAQGQKDQKMGEARKNVEDAKDSAARDTTDDTEGGGQL